MSPTAAIITCSDRAASGAYDDRSGPIIRDALVELGFDVREAVIVPDHPDHIWGAITDAITDGVRLVMTTGGTGVSPTDVTVEVTRDLIAYEIPGLMEQVRRVGAEKEPRALLSRGIAGVLALAGQQRAIIVNAPGSTGGARDTIQVVGPLLGHLIEQLDGADH